MTLEESIEAKRIPDGPEKEESTPSFDVFVSYRREGGSQVARTVQQALKGKCKVFLDVDTLGGGHFDTTLLSMIAVAPNFLLLLTEGSLNRCANDKDWLRREIATRNPDHEKHHRDRHKRIQVSETRIIA